jgi:transaldolase / glucose-6-phosphate isomerase
MTLAYAPAADLINRFLKEKVVSRIWSRDIGVWGASAGSAEAQSIRNRLGWLDVGETLSAELSRVSALGKAIAAEKCTAVYLLGMGGSSLCAEVLRAVCGIAAGHPDLFVLDTTDERTITSAAARLDPARTLFLVSSKSGGTVEVASLERFFWAHMTARSADASRHFVAITDPGTALQKLAESKRYREVFLNPPDIGGRFSALSLFGLVPCAVLGSSPRQLLTAGTTQAAGCRQENHANPGLELGAFIGAAALNGRDKLTLALPPSLASLGLWIEQLVAESTGKHGKGALPVVDEPLGRPDEYGDDRAFVAIASDRDRPDEDRLAALEEAGHPVLRLSTRIDGLGAEFFRWEFATAVAGAALGINPFDEPNVAEAKEKTKALLDIYAARARLPETAPAAESAGLSAYSPALTGASPEAVVKAALSSLQPRDYVAFLSYLPPTSDVETRIGEIRQGIRAKFRAATTFGVGPRYLHSTGQYHKGGPNRALAFVITGEDDTSTEIPEAGYTFSVLKRAQALGDAEALAAHKRRVVRLHLHAGRSIEDIEAVFADALR